MNGGVWSGHGRGGRFVFFLNQLAISSLQMAIVGWVWLIVCCFEKEQEQEQEQESEGSRRRSGNGFDVFVCFVGWGLVIAWQWLLMDICAWVRRNGF